MKSVELGVWVVAGIALAMLLSAGFLDSAGSVSAQDSTDARIFVGAGDIASCAVDRTGDDATAKLLHDIVHTATSPTVFTTGDNAYEAGSTSQYERCYGPNWGDFEAITRPSPGDHEYQTAGASGYFEYFGAEKVSYDATTKGYYSYDLGSWHMVVIRSSHLAYGLAALGIEKNGHVADRLGPFKLV